MRVASLDEDLCCGGRSVETREGRVVPHPPESHKTDTRKEKAKAVKSVISDKDSSFSAMEDTKQDEYKDLDFDQFLRSANRTFVDTISTFLLREGDKQKGAVGRASGIGYPAEGR